MSDQYTPPGSAPPISGVVPGAARDEYTRTSVHVEAPAERRPSSGGGFGTGLLVAAVFVVVALLAYAIFSGRDGESVVPASSPEVSIENNNAPAADAPAPAPDVAAPADTAPAPDATAPDAVAPDAVAPDAGTVDPVAPAPDAAPVAPANP
jgi:ribonuclease E